MHLLVLLKGELASFPQPMTLEANLLSDCEFTVVCFTKNREGQYHQNGVCVELAQ